jgi:phage protein U
LGSTAHAQWSPDYSIRRIGLFGPEHTGSAGLQESNLVFSNLPGFLAGSSTRYDTAGNFNGTDTWAWNGTTTVQVGLTGAEYTDSMGYQESAPLFQNAAGQVVGYSFRLDGSNATAAWVWNGTTTTKIGLTGGVYTGSAGAEATSPQFQSAAGQVVGISSRILGEISFNGQDCWAWNGVATTQIGFAGAGFTGSAGYQYSKLLFHNDAGQVAGISERYTGVNTLNGQHAWVWNGTTTTRVGLTGAVYTGSPGAYHRSVPTSQNASGQITGTTNRISGVSADNGSDAWVWNGATTTQIGLTGGVYTTTAGYQVSGPVLQNAAGRIAGFSYRFNGVGTRNGEDAWVWDGATTTRIGLTGALYTGSGGYRSSETKFLNAAGQVAGRSLRIIGTSTANGRDAWVWNGTTTTQIGLTGGVYTGTAGYQNSDLVSQNAAGQVAGRASRVTGVSTGNGQDAWVWDGATTTRIGLTGGVYTTPAGYQISAPVLQNAAGQIVGTSTRFTGVNTFSIGQDVWVWNGATTTLISLSGGVYTGPTGLQESFAILQNAAGQVAGYTVRVTGAGASTGGGGDAWYFDPSTNLTWAIIGSVRPIDNYASSRPTILTDDGFLLGIYDYFPAGGGMEQRAFIFRPDVGFTDLGNLVSGGLTASGWSTLQNPQFSDALRTIVGYGYVNGQTSGRSVFVLSASAPCTGDLNGDNAVNTQDLTAFLARFGTTVTPGGPGDFNNDGAVNTADLTTFLGRFGSAC